MLRYSANYHPYTVLCECLTCGAKWGLAPIVAHESWRVTEPFKGDFVSEKR